MFPLSCIFLRLGLTEAGQPDRAESRVLFLLSSLIFARISTYKNWMFPTRLSDSQLNSAQARSDFHVSDFPYYDRRMDLSVRPSLRLPSSQESFLLGGTRELGGTTGTAEDMETLNQSNLYRSHVADTHVLTYTNKRVVAFSLPVLRKNNLWLKVSIFELMWPKSNKSKNRRCRPQSESGFFANQPIWDDVSDGPDS